MTDDKPQIAGLKSQMAERLYYTDSYLVHFSGHIVERLTWQGRPAVVLDQTAFYPTSGGQPSDRGTLGGVDVLDIVVREQDNAIVHVLAQPIVHDQVKGELDWPRRFDHMQQHTGQHILSAAFEQTLGGDTVGFHLGTETCTVDINLPHLDTTATAQVEELANRVVWQDRAVGIRFVSPDELAALPLRRPPAVKGPVRLVEIADFDLNPCGGTHVARTGEIGLIKIVRLDHRRGETRVEFLCGERAWRDYRDKNEMTARLSGLLTVGHWELAQAVERLQSEAKQLRQELRRARKQLLKTESAEMAESAIAHGPYRIVRQVWQGREAGELRSVAQELARRPATVALLAAVGERTHLCFACAEGLNLDMASLLRATCSRLGGKGGGQPRLAQGSAPAADISRIEALLADLSSNL